MSEYTPTTEQVRDAYAEDDVGVPRPKYFPEFDRWLAERDRQIAEKAWQEGYDGQGGPTNPYRPTSTRRNKTMADIRTSEPTEAQVEAAAKALHETRNPWFVAHGDWEAAGFKVKQAFRNSARAALKAIQEPAQHNTTQKGRTMSKEIEAVLREAGLTEKPGELEGSIHSWECEIFDIYGACACFQSLVVDLAEAVRAAAEKAWWEACRKIADGENNPDIADTYQKQNPYLEEKNND